MRTVFRLLRWPLFAVVVGLGAAAGVAAAVFAGAGYDPHIPTDDEEGL